MAKGRLKGLLEKTPGTMNRASRRNAHRYIKEESQRIDQIRAADQMSGVGYPVDRHIRHFLDMCNADIFRGLEVPYPKVWDVVSGFFKRESSELQDFLRLRPEKDHAFSQHDFFAFATDTAIREQVVEKLLALPEGVVHNYTASGAVKDVVFEEGQTEPLVFSGISLVRHGELLYWQTVGGPVVDISRITEERREQLVEQEATIRAANPTAPEAMIRDLLNPRAVALEGTDDVWLAAALGLFNLRTRKHEIRMTTRDWGVSQAVFSDQFEQRFAEEYETSESVRRMVDRAMEQIEKDHLFFEVAETAFALPAYFAAKVEFVRGEEVTTALGDPTGGVARKHALKAPVDMRILKRTVATLDFSARGEFGHTYTPPRFRVEVDGFWRRLPSGSVGKDAEGRPTKGKTWVHSHARWKDKPPKTGTVLVKTPISTALERARKLAENKGGSYRLTIR